MEIGSIQKTSFEGLRKNNNQENANVSNSINKIKMPAIIAGVAIGSAVTTALVIKKQPLLKQYAGKVKNTLSSLKTKFQNLINNSNVKDSAQNLQTVVETTKAETQKGASDVFKAGSLVAGGALAGTMITKATDDKAEIIVPQTSDETTEKTLENETETTTSALQGEVVEDSINTPTEEEITEDGIIEDSINTPTEEEITEDGIIEDSINTPIEEEVVEDNIDNQIKEETTENETADAPIEEEITEDNAEDEDTLTLPAKEEVAKSVTEDEDTLTLPPKEEVAGSIAETKNTNNLTINNAQIKTEEEIEENIQRNKAFIQASIDRSPELFEDFGIDEDIYNELIKVDNNIIEEFNDDEFLSVILAPSNMLQVSFNEIMFMPNCREKPKNTIKEALLGNPRREDRHRKLNRRMSYKNMIKDVLITSQRIGKIRQIEKNFTPESMHKIFNADTSMPKEIFTNWLMEFHPPKDDAWDLELLRRIQETEPIVVSI